MKTEISEPKTENDAQIRDEVRFVVRCSYTPENGFSCSVEDVDPETEIYDEEDFDEFEEEDEEES